mmetsp:Transcript_88686/g.159905  ORF Transcript_88686/g.159905 Transcript_88686/m.159905 type:complete len:95 (+) Transcript_88686:1408-1692(+)
MKIPRIFMNCKGAQSGCYRSCKVALCCSCGYGLELLGVLFVLGCRCCCCCCCFCLFVLVCLFVCLFVFWGFVLFCLLLGVVFVFVVVVLSPLHN